MFTVQNQPIRIYGSPWAAYVGNWVFMARPEKAGEIWSKIPEKTDILITHGPPYGVLDVAYNMRHWGCLAL